MLLTDSSDKSWVDTIALIGSVMYPENVDEFSRGTVADAFIIGLGKSFFAIIKSWPSSLYHGNRSIVWFGRSTSSNNAPVSMLRWIERIKKFGVSDSRQFSSTSSTPLSADTFSPTIK